MRPIEWCQDHVRLLDQTLLPEREVWEVYRTPEEVAEAIRAMKIRGAPAIGIAAAYGLALAALRSPAREAAALRQELEEVGRLLVSTRPTAVNLGWAVSRVLGVADRLGAADLAALRQAVVEEAVAIAREDEEMCRSIGRHGAALVPPRARILTHCNAGALATGDYGTALGVIRAAHQEGGKVALVWVDETRPFLQGSRLTACELVQEKIPCRLVCDNM
ncbi:MAG TPA: S-methyl-5-thioribose-1-phosphate isomerase, partial [Candidatus Nitrosotenuis sp.]|nr:S-methyl-5-thioribose-1-phosphate isomerase [Candidatus Nitrosotenuis sp.]